MQLRILAEAASEAAQAVEWYLCRNERAALGLRHAIEDSIASIVESPELYRLIDDRFRECLIQGFPYAIYFEAVETGVTVFAITHTSRQPDHWRGRT